MTQKVRIAIISDTHDNLATLKKAVDWINKNGIEQIIHCGDIASFETLRTLSESFDGKIQLVFGNMDDDYSLSENLKNHPLANVVAHGKIGAIDIDGNPPSSLDKSLDGELGTVEPLGTTEGHDPPSPKAAEGKKIAFTHFPHPAEDLAKGEKYDIVFYGHTHKPWEEKIGRVRLVNPGNLAGQFYKPSFAIYDTGANRLELKILDDLCP
ncbi:MAG: metallophosphoesterase family protein [Candidatus Portnoybacteria bacterium]|nr:metallophosphoesterase family protein [Candidatus Portnoybacteria bacterium]